jgi:3-isopropylmalate/(R)-2-methylmalate dehydratase small subunit
MNNTVNGRAFVYGPNVDTDQIYPGRFLDLTDPAAIGGHAMAGADPDFVQRFQPGDLVVAGTNFGCGSSREHAVITLKAAGVGAIIAESFARIFYRNAINLGVPALVCPGIAKAVSSGDRLRVDLAGGAIVNETTGAALRAEPFSEYVLNILDSGGIKPLMLYKLN